MRTWSPIKQYSDIRFEFFEGIAKITINRPEVLNAFRPETTMQMLEAIDMCREMNEVGVVVFHR
jgi:naphthoate synthase